jgi:hypothetical protein
MHMKFPHTGIVWLAYTYPEHDSFLPVTALGRTIYSRSFRINVR